jgi:DNA-binding transcriptional ArsR family regulator
MPSDLASMLYKERDLDCVRMGDFFAIYAHATRMRIFCTLENGPKAVTDIAEEAEISVTNASQHLRLMRDRGAVARERKGQQVYYRMADPRFIEAANLIRAALKVMNKDNARKTERIAGNRGHEGPQLQMPLGAPAPIVGNI